LEFDAKNVFVFLDLLQIFMSRNIYRII